MLQPKRIQTYSKNINKSPKRHEIKIIEHVQGGARRIENRCAPRRCKIINEMPLQLPHILLITLADLCHGANRMNSGKETISKRVEC